MVRVLLPFAMWLNLHLRYETLKVLSAALADTTTFAAADHQSMVRALTQVIIDPKEDPFSPHTYPFKV
jgi:hypothetical protein